jgi:hypothetical protein
MALRCLSAAALAGVLDRVRVLPGGDDVAEEMGAFHYDSHGRACFSADEAERAAAALKDLHLPEVAERHLRQLAWQLPQEHIDFSGHFCNEEVRACRRARARICGPRLST